MSSIVIPQLAVGYLSGLVACHRYCLTQLGFPGFSYHGILLWLLEKNFTKVAHNDSIMIYLTKNEALEWLFTKQFWIRFGTYN